jgi:hypothetical protein
MEVFSRKSELEPIRQLNNSKRRRKHDELTSPSFFPLEYKFHGQINNLVILRDLTLVAKKFFFNFSFLGQIHIEFDQTFYSLRNVFEETEGVLDVSPVDLVFYNFFSDGSHIGDPNYIVKNIVKHAGKFCDKAETLNNFMLLCLFFFTLGQKLYQHVIFVDKFEKFEAFSP